MAPSLPSGCRVQQQQQAHRVRGVDGAWVVVHGQGQGLVVAVDLGTGVPVAVARVDEKDPASVTAWLAPLAARLGVEVLVTDDVARYTAVADQLSVDQQVCLFHLRHWVGRALGKLRAHLDPAWHPLLDQIQPLVRTLPADGGTRLLALWQHLPSAGPVTQARTALDNLRQRLARLHRDWQVYRVAVQRVDVPSTNNGTEQVIGRFKVRSRSVRGFTAWSGVEMTMLLTSGTTA